MRPRPLKKAFDLNKRLDVEKSRRNSRSQSLELDYRSLRAGQSVPGANGVKEEEKTFSVTLLVNENEKNVIVDMINRAKNIISRKVEKVIGKKPKNSVSNVETLQTVLESWIGHEESREREEKAEEEQLIREQELQVSDMARRGLPVPVTFHPREELARAHSDMTEEENKSMAHLSQVGNADMEISRISWGRQQAADEVRRPLSPSNSTRRQSAGTPTLAAAENVPCPWGLRPDSELYPPRLRRPSSMYGTEAAAASSRPPSRLQVLSASPVPFTAGSRPHSRQISASPLPSKIVSLSGGIEVGSSDSTIVLHEEDEEKGDVDADKVDTTDVDASEDKTGVDPTLYCRPASFLIPIGGVWRPEDDPGDNEIVWEQEKESKDDSGGRGVAPFDPSLKSHLHVVLSPRPAD
jgi:hypothetical protein